MNLPAKKEKEEIEKCRSIKRKSRKDWTQRRWKRI